MALSRGFRLLLFVTLALLVGGLATFAWLRATTPAPVTYQQVRQLAAACTELVKARRLEEAEDVCREQARLQPDSPYAAYDLACALALQGKTEQALEVLEGMAARGYDDADYLRADEDLASLRGLPRFEAVLARARETDRSGGPWPVHQGEPLTGVKTVEGFPEGGLRYRLRVPPDASREKPARLIIWLHPSYSLANTPVERMAPLFAQRGFALLVPTQKEVEGWREKDQRKFLEVTLPELGKLEGLDVRKPVLMGFSAGGQVALTAWGKEPERWGGLILDAAYPLLGEGPDARGEWAMQPVPDSPAISKVPLFVLVGTEDGWSWKTVEPTWKKAGVPLTVHYIQGRGHEWLFDAPEARELLAWLERLSPP